MAANGKTNRERENRNRCRSAAAAAVVVLSPTKGKVCGDGDNGESAKRSSPLLLRSRSREMSGMMMKLMVMTITGFCKVGKRANDDDLLYDIYDSRFSLSASERHERKHASHVRGLCVVFCSSLPCAPG